MIAPPSMGMLSAMLALQDKMNRKINSEWITAGYPYLRAVLVEAVEALEHHGWKWWSKQVPNFPQLRIELIDIWHFILSEYLIRMRGDVLGTARVLVHEWNLQHRVEFDGRSIDVDDLELSEALELLAGLSAVRRTSMPLFSAILGKCGLDAETLFREYVSKNVLNHFRQDHGYKTGNYLKQWSGVEDNAHLADILAGLQIPDEQLPEALYNALEHRYEELRANGKLS